MTIDWAHAGGPNECSHGFAAGIPCEKCGPHKVEYDQLGISPDYIAYDSASGMQTVPFDPVNCLHSMRGEAEHMIGDTHREGRKHWCRKLVALDVAVDAVDLVNSNRFKLMKLQAKAWEIRHISLNTGLTGELDILASRVAALTEGAALCYMRVVERQEQATQEQAFMTDLVEQANNAIQRASSALAEFEVQLNRWKTSK